MYRRISGFLLVITLLLSSADAWGQGRVDVRGGRAVASVARGWIGISFRATSPGENSPLVEAVDPGAPADAAGIRPGDRIVSWNGRTDVVAAINSTRLQPGETVQLRISRTGEGERDVSVVAAPRPAVRVVRVGPAGLTPGAERRMMLRGDSLRIHADSLQSRLRLMLRDSLGPRMGNPAEVRAMVERLRGSAFDNVRAFQLNPGVGAALAFGRSGVAGAEFADITTGLGSYFGTDKGALVLRVAPNTPAARAGLAEGDVIVRAADQNVESVIDLRRAVAGTRDDIALEILRRNERFTVTIQR